MLLLALVVGLGFPGPRSVVGLQTSGLLHGAPIKESPSADLPVAVNIQKLDDLLVYLELEEEIASAYGRPVQLVAGSIGPVMNSFHDWLDPA